MRPEDAVAEEPSRACRSADLQKLTPVDFILTL
jgi:hypothetical protein